MAGDLDSLIGDAMAVAQFLHHCRPAGTVPQIVLADANKKALAWMPGNRLQAVQRKFRGTPRAIGLTPGAFYDPNQPQHSQSCFLCFAGADFDKVTQKTLDALLTDPLLSIRTSSSGRGLHAFLRFTRPVEAARTDRTRVVRAALSHRLEALGVMDAVDKVDFRAFYVVGGRQKWVRQVEEAVDPPEVLPEDSGLMDCGIDENQEEFAPAVQAVVDILRAGGVKLKAGTNQVYIRQIHSILKNTPHQFPTRSSMRPDQSAHVNGFIVIAEGGTVLQIIPNADGHPVLTIRDPLYYERLVLGRKRK